MKKKSASQSAFFNLRVLIGLFIVVAGVFLALAGFGIAQAQQKSHIITNSKDPLVPNGFDCSKMHELGIDKQENFRAQAIMIACGRAQGGSTSHGGIVAQVIQKLPLPSAIKKLLTPLAYGAADVDLVTGAETSPHVTQSETFSTANPDNPDQIVVAYNDSRGRNASPINISGASVSTDDGATWTNERQLSASFLRDVQITGDKVTGDVYVAAMDEGGGGFPHNDTNKIYRSTDGGNTWTNTYTGSPFPGPGVIDCSEQSYFACMFSDGGGYWRHEGWGQPAAYNHVVSLVYAQHGTGADPGDVYYIRSTDSGVTFSAPFKLNTDSTTRPQWQPNISVSDAGTLFTTWYDARESASCTRGSPGVPCYRMWSRKSNDNGVSWLADDTLSDVVSPLPAQPDPGIFGDYTGDYDYGSAILTKHLTSWVDGRVAISGTSQQDAFTDRELVGFAVTTTDPACNSLINTQPTDFTVNLSDPVNTGTVDASDFTVNGTPSNLPPTFMNGNATIIFHYSSTPVTLGTNTMHIPAGAFNRQSDGQPNFEFTCSFCYAVTQLMVTTTNPPVGGTFTGPGNQTLDVDWNMAVDPASVTPSDLTITGVAGTVTNVSFSNG